MTLPVRFWLAIQRRGNKLTQLAARSSQTPSRSCRPCQNHRDELCSFSRHAHVDQPHGQIVQRWHHHRDSAEFGAPSALKSSGCACPTPQVTTSASSGWGVTVLGSRRCLTALRYQRCPLAGCKAALSARSSEHWAQAAS